MIIYIPQLTYELVLNCNYLVVSYSTPPSMIPLDLTRSIITNHSLKSIPKYFISKIFFIIHIYHIFKIFDLQALFHQPSSTSPSLAHPHHFPASRRAAQVRPSAKSGRYSGEFFRRTFPFIFKSGILLVFYPSLNRPSFIHIRSFLTYKSSSLKALI